MKAYSKFILAISVASLTACSTTPVTQPENMRALAMKKYQECMAMESPPYSDLTKMAFGGKTDKASLCKINVEMALGIKIK